MPPLGGWLPAVLQSVQYAVLIVLALQNFVWKRKISDLAVRERLDRIDSRLVEINKLFSDVSERLSEKEGRVTAKIYKMDETTMALIIRMVRLETLWEERPSIRTPRDSDNLLGVKTV